MENSDSYTYMECNSMQGWSMGLADEINQFSNNHLSNNTKENTKYEIDGLNRDDKLTEKLGMTHSKGSSKSIDSNEELIVVDPIMVSMMESENVSIDNSPLQSNRKLIKFSKFMPPNYSLCEFKVPVEYEQA
jgi:hydroxymethylpyrimidine/phosphomethylpyrimidine kinase